MKEKEGKTLRFAVILVGLIGIACIIAGWLLWKKERITLLHDYHYENVAPKDKKAFCTLCGIGMICLGAGMVLTAVILGITESLWSFLVFAAGFAVGLGFLIYAGKTYNP